MNRRVSAFLIDFDGPVCSVFDGYPPAEAAHELACLLPEPPDDPGTDPLEVLRNAPCAQVEQLDTALTRIELRAIETAAPNPEFHQLIRVVGDRPWAIVSNNSTDAVHAYLRRELPQYAHVPALGRPPARVDLMKPNPHLVCEALKALSVTARRSVLIGDSVTDVQAGKDAGVYVIGYANKPGKAERLAAAGADEIAVPGRRWWESL